MKNSAMLEQRMQPRDGHLLGGIVESFYDFLVEGKCNPNYEVFDPVSYEVVRAGDFFQTFLRKRPGSYLVAPDKLPFHQDVRAIMTFGSKVLVETTKVDFDKWREHLDKELSVPKGRKTVYSQGDEVIRTKTQNVINSQDFRIKDVRTLLTVLPAYGGAGFDEAISALDSLWNNSCFYPLKDVYSDGNENTISLVSDLSSGATPKPELKLKLELRQFLQTVQRPELGLRFAQLASIAQYGRVLRDSTEDLKKRVYKEAEKNPFLDVDN